MTKINGTYTWKLLSTSGHDMLVNVISRTFLMF